MKPKIICNVKPIRAMIEKKRLTYVSRSEVTYVKPCGQKYTDRHDVHCGKYEDCEYYKGEI